jgi:hypothetical protein
MKITIDTKEDSHADIQKVMQILSHFTNKDPISNYSPESQETNERSNAGFMNMFGDSSTEEQTPQATETPDAAPDFSNFLNLAQKQEEEKKEDKPRLQFF